MVLNTKDMGNEQKKSRAVAVIVAHPDDETLWAGGTIAGDKDRPPRFFRALKILGAEGNMGDLDDGPEQNPLAQNEVESTILQLLPHRHFDLIISHNPAGEYTRHLRHEEIGRAVITLWQAGQIAAPELWAFAYEDGGKQYLPRPVKTADIYQTLPEIIWQKKCNLVTATYGFGINSFEAKTTASSRLKLRIKTFEFTAGIIDLELPINAALVVIGLSGPGLKLTLAV